MPDIPAERSLIEYPSAFPIKVMGAHVEGFVEALVAVAQRFDPTFDPATVHTRESRAGRWLEEAAAAWRMLLICHATPRTHVCGVMLLQRARASSRSWCR